MNEVQTYRQRIPTIRAMRINGPEDKVKCLNWLVGEKIGVKARMSQDYALGLNSVRLFLTVATEDGEVEREVDDGEWVMVDVMTEQVSTCRASGSGFAREWQAVEPAPALDE